MCNNLYFCPLQDGGGVDEKRVDIKVSVHPSVGMEEVIICIDVVEGSYYVELSGN